MVFVENENAHKTTDLFDLCSIMKTPGSVLLAPSPAHGETNYDLMYYLKGAAAGGICCSITHGALTPVDVVKTRVQLDPVKVGHSTLLHHHDGLSCVCT
jgi:hypothetical protein